MTSLRQKIFFCIPLMSISTLSWAVELNSIPTGQNTVISSTTNQTSPTSKKSKTNNNTSTDTINPQQNESITKTTPADNNSPDLPAYSKQVLFDINAQLQTKLEFDTTENSHDDHEEAKNLSTFEDFLITLQEDSLIDCNKIIDGMYQLYQPACEYILTSTGSKTQTEACLAQASITTEQHVALCEKDKQDALDLLKMPQTEIKRLYHEAYQHVSNAHLREEN